MAEKRLLRLSTHDREIFALAVPALGALAADPLVSLVDTAFVSRLGPVPLGALGINTAIFAFTFVIFNFLAYGVTPMVGRAYGRGDREAAGRLISQALLLAAVAGAASVAVLQVLAPLLIAWMGASGETAQSALAYLRIRIFSGPAVLAVMAGHGAYRGLQDTRTPLRITLILNAVNLILDPLFIFGLGWGLAGAAWATAAAQWTGALLFVRGLLTPARSPVPVRLTWHSLRSLLPFLRTGGHLLVRTLALMAALTLATAVAARMGTVAVAAHHAASQLWLLLALVLDALAIAAQALIARHAGAGRFGLAREQAERMLQMGLAAGIVLGLAIWALRRPLAAFIASDPEVVSAVLSVFPFVAAMQPLNALVFIWDGIFMGAEDFGFLAGAMAFAGLACAAALAAAWRLDWGLVGVWWAIALLIGVRLVTLALRHRRFEKVLAKA